MLRGEPGIGKTSILLNAERQAEGSAYYGLTGSRRRRASVLQLFIGFSCRFSESPRPYLPPNAEHWRPRSVASKAGPLTDSSSDSPVLTLLSGVSAHAPLLCIIDDAQWLDGETKELLAFVARRLFAESLVLLVAVRGPSDGPDAFTGLPELEIRGLESTDAWGLLSAAFNRQLDVAMMGRLVHARRRATP